MSIVKEKRHEHELAIFSARHEVGAQAIFAWLVSRREDINLKWPGLSGEDLIRLQGEARGIDRLIEVIADGPAIKKIERVPT